MRFTSGASSPPPRWRAAAAGTQPGGVCTRVRTRCAIHTQMPQQPRALVAAPNCGQRQNMHGVQFEAVAPLSSRSAC